MKARELRFVGARPNLRGNDSRGALSDGNPHCLTATAATLTYTAPLESPAITKSGTWQRHRPRHKVRHKI
jgi:hypothetical protein